MANESVRCGFRNEEGVGQREGQQLGTHSVKYLWLRKPVAGPWRQADKEPVCLKPLATDPPVGEEMVLISVSNSLQATPAKKVSGTSEVTRGELWFPRRRLAQESGPLMLALLFLKLTCPWSIRAQ